jgi:hypothetical protein
MEYGGGWRAVAVDERLLLFGGTDAAGHIYQDVWQTNEDGMRVS